MKQEENIVLAPETENAEATARIEEEVTLEESEQIGMAGKVIISVLSILAIMLLFPIALAFAAFGIPVLNGSLMNT